VLAGWERAEAALAAVQRDDATLLVGMSTGLGRGLLPSIHARVAAALPDTRLRVRQVDWGDPTGGLAADDADRTDAAFVWLPLPDGDRLAWLHVATEPRLVALPATHPLARGDSLHFGALLDEPFLALPISSGALRDHWLAVEARGGRPALIGAEVRSAEETVEALRAGLGVCLVASGNAELIDRDGVVLRPVHGLASSTLVLAWRRGDDRPAVRALRVATEQVVSGEFPATPVPKGPQGAVEPTAAR
jgi:DNA-binding transcriptional LysR family regulator